MARELWEKVDTRTLKPGEVVVNYAGENVVWDAGDSQIVNDNPAGPWHIPCLFRRYTGPSPEVLMRALELAVDYMSGTDKIAQAEVVREFIADAKAEIEKEQEA